MAQSAAPVAAGCEGLKRFIAHAVARFLGCVYRVRSNESRWIHEGRHCLTPNACFWRKADVEEFAATHRANNGHGSFHCVKNAAANSVFLSKCTIATEFVLKTQAVIGALADIQNRRS